MYQWVPAKAIFQSDLIPTNPPTNNNLILNLPLNQPTITP
nr:MAG TPA: hypothetical protein [Caudoviricetes sp.]